MLTHTRLNVRIQIPQHYLATNWPILYSSISADGRLVAVAGRRGLIHYSSTSGRWKTFSDRQQEQAFVLIAAVEVTHSYQVYSILLNWICEG